MILLSALCTQRFTFQINTDLCTNRIYAFDAVLGNSEGFMSLTNLDKPQDFIIAFDKIPWIEGYSKKCSKCQILDKIWGCSDC